MNSATATKPSTSKDLAKPGPTAIATAEEPAKATDKFVAKIQRNFQGAGELSVRWTDLQARLAQHLAVKIEMALDIAETRRLKSKKADTDPPFTWENINLEGLTVKAKNIIDLELDASMPNHVHVVPYLNGRTGKYDVDLRIGYEGVLYSKQKFATVSPVSVICKLVFDGDEFEVIYNEQGGEDVLHKPKSYFRPGEVIGGYGIIKFTDPSLNRVIIVDEYEFEKAEKGALSKDFWGGEFYKQQWDNNLKRYVNVGEATYDPKFRRDMQFKTVVLRVCKHLKLDPAKVNADAWVAVEAAEIDSITAEVAEDIAENANAKELPAPAPEAPAAAVDPNKPLF